MGQHFHQQQHLNIKDFSIHIYKQSLSMEDIVCVSVCLVCDDSCLLSPILNSHSSVWGQFITYEQKYLEAITSLAVGLSVNQSVGQSVSQKHFSYSYHTCPAGHASYDASHAIHAFLPFMHLMQFMK